MLFPYIGFQIIIEPSSPEDFHAMEVKNVLETAECDAFPSNSKQQLGKYLSAPAPAA